MALAPKWAPKDKNVPLKEEIVAFHREVSRFHDCVEGVLQEFPDLAKNLTDMPEPLDSYTDKPQNLSHVTELVIFLSDVWVLYEEAQRMHSEATLSTRSTSSGPAPCDNITFFLHFPPYSDDLRSPRSLRSLSRPSSDPSDSFLRFP